MVISVSVRGVGVKGEAVFRVGGVRFVMSADDVRLLYYRVLGIEFANNDGGLAEYVKGEPGSVDVPEDVLRVERWLDEAGIDKGIEG